MTTILITGANGFVGSHTLKFLMSKPDIRLIAACRDRSKLLADFAGEVRDGDLRDASYVSKLLDGVDVVVNAAAWSSLWAHEAQSGALFYRPSIDLIEAYLASSATRFVNISSTSVATPDTSHDAMSPGIPKAFWPHMGNVIRIENYLRQRASTKKSVINLRFGLFVGERYGLGLLPILLPRLKTHLVPWVAGGKTRLPLIDGRDCGQAMGLAAMAQGLEGYCAFNIVGPESPTVREVISFLHDEFGYPKPHFSVPFKAAYAFGWAMEKLDPLVPWEPLIVRSIVHLLEETGANNAAAAAAMGYLPRHDWRDALGLQIAELAERQKQPMGMAKPAH